jgi:hypothetical protein
MPTTLYTSFPSTIMNSFQTLDDFLILHPIAIFACIVTYYIIGMVWYGFLFQKQYVRLHNINPNTVTKEHMKDGMRKGSLASFLTGLTFAVTLAVGMQYIDATDLKSLLTLSTVLWFAFTALPFAQTNAYLRKSFKLTLIDAGYILVSLWAMSIILFMSVQ